MFSRQFVRRLGTTASTARPGVVRRGSVLFAFAAGTAVGALVLSSVSSPRTVQSVSTTTTTTLTTTSTSSTPKPKEKNKTYDVPALLSDLRAALPLEHQVSTDAEILHAHGFSENDYHPGSTPTVVVYPDSTEDVVGIVKVARKHGIPVVTYGGGTSLEGHWRAPKEGAISVDMSGMNRILAIHEADSDLVCQPGIGWMDINAELARRGIPLFFPIDPAPGASIGGMVSTGCSGTNAVRYGTAKGEWFLNLTVVLPSGEVIKTRRRARKSSAGFDTTKLFVGAEGTLGIVTEVTLRLAPVLPTTVATVHFPDVRAATAAATAIVNSGAGIQCIELVDDLFMRGTNIYNHPSVALSPTSTIASNPHSASPVYPERDALFIKLQGPSAHALAESAALARSIAATHGGTDFRLARSDAEGHEMWRDRKNALYSGLALGEEVLNKGGEGSPVRGWSTDVCVPVSNLPELVYETKKDIERSGLVSTIVGHVGDGNFHALLLFKDDADLETAHALVSRMVNRAIALDGTCTGEHGVGIGKREYLVHELGPGAVKPMKAIKHALDPEGLFNPGKLYPDDDDVEGEKE